MKRATRRPRLALPLATSLFVAASLGAPAASLARKPRAADIRVMRKVLRVAKHHGFTIRRIQPLDPRMLRHPSHAKTLPKDPVGSNISGKLISVAKGKLRSWRRPGGANHAASTLLHELGHGLYFRQRGELRPRPKRGRLASNHPMRYVERVVAELQANNMAIGLLRQIGASDTQIREYKRSRRGSYRSHTRAMPKSMARHPEYREYRGLIRTLQRLPGFTPSGSITRDLPDVKRLADAVSASTGDAPSR